MITFHKPVFGVTETEPLDAPIPRAHFCTTNTPMSVKSAAS